MEIYEKTCVPCQGGVPALTVDEAAQFARAIPKWEVRSEATRLVRDFKFKDYVAALAFVNAISAIAEAEGHHPDVSFGWGYASVTLYTHKIKGLHENDFIMAAKIDRVIAK